MRLYLVRHPQPLVDVKRCYGATDLAPAPMALESVLSNLLISLPQGLPVISSPLQRCAQLAQALATRRTCSLQYDARLVEMNFGTWEMQTWDQIARPEIDAWADDVVNYRVGGGESVLQMAQRVAGFYADVRLLAQDQIVICHAGSIRLLMACQQGLGLQEAAEYAAQQSRTVAYGEVLCLDMQSG